MAIAGNSGSITDIPRKGTFASFHFRLRRLEDEDEEKCELKVLDRLHAAIIGSRMFQLGRSWRA